MNCTFKPVILEGKFTVWIIALVKNCQREVRYPCLIWNLRAHTFTCSILNVHCQMLNYTSGCSLFLWCEHLPRVWHELFKTATSDARIFFFLPTSTYIPTPKGKIHFHLSCRANLVSWILWPHHLASDFYNWAFSEWHNAFKCCSMYFSNDLLPRTLQLSAAFEKAALSSEVWRKQVYLICLFA